MKIVFLFNFFVFFTQLEGKQENILEAIGTPSEFPCEGKVVLAYSRPDIVCLFHSELMLGRGKEKISLKKKTPERTMDNSCYFRKK